MCLRLTRSILGLLLLALSSFSISASAEDISFPESSGVIDITQAPYNAVGDGVSDDSDAIIKAIQENVGHYETRTLYFPNGTYLISKQLPWKTSDGVWHCYLSLQGQSTDGTIIKLADESLGFQSANSPQAVVYTASQYYTTSHDPDNLGEGNEAYANFVQNLTIDVGENPGAVGIDFLGNNYAGIYSVKLKGNGHIGLSMQRYGAGPLLVKNLEVEGFGYGIKTAKQDYGITFENIFLKDQSVAGISNEQNILSIYNLTSHNSVTAIENTDSIGHIALVKGILVQGNSELPAIKHAGYGLYLKDIITADYAVALQLNGESQTGSVIKEYSPNNHNLHNQASSSLGLTIKETPTLPDDPVSEWANVLDFGANMAEAYQNKTQAIQEAMNSGASTVFLPSGFYLINEPINVPGHVNRIISPGCRFDLAWNNSFNDPTSPKGLFQISESSESPLEISKIYYWGAFLGNAEVPPAYSVFAVHSSARNLILKDIQNYGFRNEAGCGDLFLEDICIDDIHFSNPQNVWARQFNTEYSKTGFKCINNGGNLWILGLKTEQPDTIVKTTNNGSTEILGGLIYPVNPVDTGTPAFISDESRLSVIYSTTAYDLNADYTIHVEEIRDGKTHLLSKPNVEARGYGSRIPLFRSKILPLSAPSAPTALKATFRR
ncbi:glycoside hydrolase family 55 protein [Puniceicoccaceae bacterium K14]|nr:glycoside hydrolase family 55 protein [Puniceicoccaceae bacterium K14]